MLQPINAFNLQTYEITLTSGNPFTDLVMTPRTGNRFVVYNIHIQTVSVTNILVQFQSGSVNISGQMFLFGITATGTRSNFQVGDGRTPILVGRAAGEAFNVLKNSGGTAAGWATVGEFTELA